jgi:predicted outer membrane repeat protein
VDLGAKGLTLRSTGGKGVTTIRGASTGSTVRVSGGGQIEGFFIQGGGGDEESGVRRGGAMRITAGSVTIKDCDIRAGDVGASGEGGLVFIRDAAPNFVNCRLEMGTASEGGGVYARATDATVRVPTFTDCLVRNNSAASGGGIFLRGAGMQPTLLRVTFEQNIASVQGSAILSTSGARPSLSGCRACGNTTPVIVGGFDETGLNRMSDDCNGDGSCDADQIASGELADDDADGIPDVCQDCDGDGESDRYSIAQGLVPDCNGNQVPDACDLASGEPDCNANGVPDSCDGPDCNGNGSPDACDLANGAPDCNANGIVDSCEIGAGMLEDQDANGVPDACQYAVGDLDLNGVTDTGDLAFILLLFDSPGPIGDLDGDQLVTTADLALLLLNFE